MIYIDLNINAFAKHNFSKTNYCMFVVAIHKRKNESVYRVYIFFLKEIISPEISIYFVTNSVKVKPKRKTLL